MSGLGYTLMLVLYFLFLLCTWNQFDIYLDYFYLFQKIRSKDALQIKLLLTYLQNGIQEPWQKIPSIIAIFAAEASFVLLDPSQDRFRKISKLLVHSPRVNLKVSCF